MQRRARVDTTRREERKVTVRIGIREICADGVDVR